MKAHRKEIEKRPEAAGLEPTPESVMTQSLDKWERKKAGKNGVRPGWKSASSKWQHSGMENQGRKVVKHPSCPHDLEDTSMVFFELCLSSSSRIKVFVLC